MTRAQFIQYLIDTGYKWQGYGSMIFTRDNIRIVIGAQSARMDVLTGGRWQCKVKGWLSKMAVGGDRITWIGRSR